MKSFGSKILWALASPVLYFLDASPILFFGSKLSDNFSSDISSDKFDSKAFSRIIWNWSESLLWSSASPNMFIAFYNEVKGEFNQKKIKLIYLTILELTFTESFQLIVKRLHLSFIIFWEPLSQNYIIIANFQGFEIKSNPIYV